MGRVLISIQPELDSGAQEFLLAVANKLKFEGIEVIFWSIFPQEILESHSLPSHWDLRKWPEIYKMDVEPGRIDREKVWRSRLADYQCIHFKDTPVEQLLDTVYGASANVIKHLKPDLFLCWAPLTPYFGLAKDVCTGMGIPSLCFEHGFFKGSLLLDKGGLYGLSELCGKELEELSGWQDSRTYWETGERVLSELRKERVDRYEADESLLYLPDSKGVKVLCLGTNDRAAGYSPAGNDEHRANLREYNSSLEAALEVSRVNRGVTVFRPHPQMKEETIKGYAEGLVIDSNGPIENWLEWSDIIVSLGTNLEFAAMAFNKPVVQMVPSALTGKQVVYEVEDKGSVQRKLEEAKDASDFTRRRENLARFCGYLMRHYLYCYSKHEIRVETAERFISRIKSSVKNWSRKDPVNWGRLLKTSNKEVNSIYRRFGRMIQSLKV